MPPRRSQGLGQILLVCLAGIGAFLGAAAGALALGEDLDLIGIVQRGTAVLALVLIPLLELPTWENLRSSTLWERATDAMRRGLTRLFAAKSATLVAIGISGLLMSASPAVVGAFGVLIAVLFTAHWLVLSHQDRECRLTPRSQVGGGRNRTLASLPPGGRSGFVVYLPRPVEIASALARGAWRARVILSMPAVLLLLAGLLCTVAFAVNVARKHHKHHTEPSPPPSHGGHTRHVESSGSQTQNQTTSTTETTPSSEHVWLGTCPALPKQTEAKEPAVGAITRRYAPGTYPEPIEKGCMTHIYPKEFRHEFYAEMTGMIPGTYTPLSLCVDSEAFGVSIFLWAIAAEIEKLISEVGPVGGPPVKGGYFPRYTVGNRGEMYLVDSRKGIYMFVRRTSAETWVKLVPTLTRAALGAMNANHHQWLWASQPKPEPGGAKVVELRLGPDEEPVARITLKPNGTAVGDGVEYHPHTTPDPRQKATRRERLSVAELEARALTAR